MSTDNNPGNEGGTTAGNKDCCNSPAIDSSNFDNMHSKISLERETLMSRSKNDPNAKYKADLIKPMLGKMDLTKTQHAKDIKEQNTRDASVKSVASNYTTSISNICASLDNEGELSDLVMCSAKYQLMVLLCIGDACKQDDLIQLIQELSLIVKDCESLDALLEKPSIIDAECNSDISDKCEKYLKDSTNCDNLKKIMMKLQVYDEIDLCCKGTEELCDFSDCDDLKETLAGSYKTMHETSNAYICLKNGCGETASCIVDTKQYLERLLQVIKNLATNAKNQLKITQDHLQAFNTAINKRNQILAVLQYCYLLRSRALLSGDLKFDENILMNDFYNIVDIVISYGACKCSQEETSTTINDIWCTYKKAYIACINGLYCKEVTVFEGEYTWICASTEYNECLSNLEKNVIDQIEGDLKPKETTPKTPEDPENGDSSCKSEQNTKESEPTAK